MDNFNSRKSTLSPARPTGAAHHDSGEDKTVTLATFVNEATARYSHYNKTQTAVQEQIARGAFATDKQRYKAALKSNWDTRFQELYVIACFFSYLLFCLVYRASQLCPAV